MSYQEIINSLDFDGSTYSGVYNGVYVVLMSSWGRWTCELESGGVKVRASANSAADALEAAVAGLSVNL